MANEAWTSTKAFSVYNVLLSAKHSMNADEVETFLRTRFRDDIDGSYVGLGVGYLIAKRMVGTLPDGKLGLTHPGRRVKRVNDDIDLDWA